MNRKEKVYMALKELCRYISIEELNSNFKGFDASTIGKKINVSRSNTSRELNTLLNEKKVIKLCGRPVYFLDKNKIEQLLELKIKNSDLEINSISTLLEYKKNSHNKKIHKSIFNSMIGSNNSLNFPITQAKAAILYPPNGLHTLLIGPTGVGKSTFAEMMYNYALENNKISSDSKFVVFNCSEYTDNPQLLLSQLFGYAKGSFTGANTCKEGLIEKADGGILFLDEVHRLPPEGQEMLFTVMDKGTFRRMGETNTTRKANVFFISATTEDISSSLLKTFSRRIPMVIKLPSLNERSLKERFDLVNQFFKDEAKCVNVPIKVSKDVIKSFLLYNCQGNIGQLKGDIQLTCARGFLEYKTYNKNEINLTISSVPEYVYEGILKSKENRKEILDLMDNDYKQYYEFSNLSNDNFPIKTHYDISEDLYKEINHKYNIYSQKGYSQKQINELINTNIKDYLKNLLAKCNTSKESPNNKEVYKFISPKIYKAVEFSLKAAEKKLQRKFTKKIYIALSMHISALMERISHGNTIKNLDINKIALNHPNEFNCAKLMHNILEKELQISIPKEETGIIAMFLYTIDSNENKKNNNIGIIVLAHGKSTASSIAEVANSLLDTNHCKAIDMPLNEKIETTLEKASNLVKKVDTGKGVLMLVDMGSLLAFGEIITKKTNIKTRCIEMVSTPMVIEAVRKCFLPKVTLDELANDLQKLSPYMGRLITNNFENEILPSNPKRIITTCLTGEGTAINLAELIKKSIPLINEYNISVEPMNINKFKLLKKEDIRNILAIIGTVDFKLNGIPYIPIDELILGNGFKTIQQIINKNHNGFNFYNYSDSNLIIQILRDGLSFLNPSKAYNILKTCFSELCKNIKINEYNKAKIEYIIHSCYMIERVLKKETLPYNNVNNHIEKNINLYTIIKKSFNLTEETFGISIPDSELAYIIDLIDKHLN